MKTKVRKHRRKTKKKVTVVSQHKRKIKRRKNRSFTPGNQLRSPHKKDRKLFKKLLKEKKSITIYKNGGKAGYTDYKRRDELNKEINNLLQKAKKERDSIGLTMLKDLIAHEKKTKVKRKSYGALGKSEIEERRKYFKEYRQRPEVKEKRKEYRKEYEQRPETKVKIRGYLKKYYEKPETKAKQREYWQKYQQTLEYKARKKKVRDKPEVKARKKEYLKKYYQRPEIKARFKEYQKEYGQRPEVKEYRQRPEVKARAKAYYKEYYLRRKKR